MIECTCKTDKPPQIRELWRSRSTVGFMVSCSLCDRFYTFEMHGYFVGKEATRRANLEWDYRLGLFKLENGL